jgi:hypothetical protein
MLAKFIYFLTTCSCGFHVATVSHVCVCSVCACVCASARVCACLCACVCVRAYVCMCDDHVYLWSICVFVCAHVWCMCDDHLFDKIDQS